MKDEIIRVAKPHRPLNGDKVISDLKKTFPDFEAIPLDRLGKAFVIKQSAFAGARIDVGAKQISLKGKVPDPLARVMDLALFGTISAAKTHKVVNRLKRFLKEHYAE